MYGIVDVLDKLKEINIFYGIDNTDVETCIQNFSVEKVCTPIIGKFSGGKSALCNGLLGYKILREGIIPKTSIPTEIVYDECEYVEIYKKFENTKFPLEISISEYTEKNFLPEEVSRVRLHLNNSFLKEISDVMIVDMPGFESGIEIHNIAINNYIDRRQVYLFVIPADDLILKSYIIDILLEIYNYEKPVYFVITKCDKVPDEIIKNNVCEMGKKLKNIGDKDFKFAYASVVNGDIDNVKGIFYGIQKNAKDIIANKYIKKFKGLSDITIKFLREVIKNNELTESELAEKEEKLLNEIKKTNEDILETNKNFDLSIEECINNIQNDLNINLHNKENSLIIMVLNGNDISEKLNSIVRSSVTDSIQKRFVPLVENYINKMSGIMDIDINVFAGVTISESIKTGTGGAVAVGVLSGLILGPIGGFIIGCLAKFFFKRAAEKRREEEKARIRNELNNNVFPNIMSQVKNRVEIEIKKKVMEINDLVEKNIETNKNIMTKALEDVKAQRERETEENKNIISKAREDIKLIEDIRKNELYL